MTSSTGKVVTLKDITNVQTKIHQSSDSNNLDTLVQCLKGMECILPLYKKFVYSSLFIQFLQLNFTLMTRMSLQTFFQDCIMKATFSSYPELIMVGATYKLNEFCMPLYILIVDGNGQSEITGVYLTSQETIMKIVSVWNVITYVWWIQEW